MAKICPLYSGSTGNCTYIGTADTDILIDAGVSCKSIANALLRFDADIKKIKYITVTHCHDDHIKGLRAVLKLTDATLIATRKTLNTIALKGIATENSKCVAIDESDFTAGDIKVNFFPTSHDSEGSCGYKFLLPDGKSFALCTDTGVLTDEIRLTLTGSDVVLLESNHDLEMLKNGPYPPFLKLRIMSNEGHISNSACAGEVARLYKNGTRRFILGHLSFNNNTPFLAQSTTESALMDLGAKNGRDYILQVAGKENNGVVII